MYRNGTKINYRGAKLVKTNGHWIMYYSNGRWGYAPNLKLAKRGVDSIIEKYGET